MIRRDSLSHHHLGIEQTPQSCVWCTFEAGVCGVRKHVHNRTSWLLFLPFSKTRELWSSKAAFNSQLRFPPHAVSHNYNCKQQTLKQRNWHKTDQNPPSANHKLWPFEPVEVNFSFLRVLLRWLIEAKNTNISWLLNFRICVFLKSSAKLFCYN